MPELLARTVLGDVAPAHLGRVDYHEHLFQSTPLLPGEDLDDEDASAAEAALLAASGFEAMIDATPIGLGRRPVATARISTSSGLSVVATTGLHQDDHYDASHWVRAWSDKQLIAALIEDIQTGLPEYDSPVPTGRTNVPAGLLKAGVGYWRISSFERRTLGAVAAVHAETRAPVMVHLEHGSAAFEVLEVLAADGVPAEAVVLAHIDRLPDPYLHADLAAQGAYLGYDGFARGRSWPDSAIVECAVRAASLGAAERILVGGDVARRSRYRAYGGLPGLEYLGLRGIPLIERLGGAELVELWCISNPHRFLARFPS